MWPAFREALANVVLIVTAIVVATLALAARTLEAVALVLVLFVVGALFDAAIRSSRIGRGLGGGP